MVVEQIVNPMNLGPGSGPPDVLMRIKAGIKALKSRNKATKTYKDYYAGRQPLTYASDSYRDYFAKMVSSYRENLCPAIVDAISDRLQLTGMTIETQDEPENQEPGPPPQGTLELAGQPQDPPTEQELAGAALWAIWKANRMGWRAGQVHKEASKTGDAFVMVARDPITEAPRIYPQDSDRVHAHYDAETEMVDWAIKIWCDDDGTGRCNYYAPEATYRFRANRRGRPGTADGLPSEQTMWLPLDEEPVVTNPQGRVPVFHFANNADVGQYGISDLSDVLPIQDALNKAVSDMLVAGEFAAYPQRWATGLTEEKDPTTGKPIAGFKPGLDRLWSAGDPEAKFGAFPEANIEQMIAEQQRFKSAAADVVGVPAHYMMMTPTEWPSGESLKTAEARFVAKIKDRQVAFGSVWEDVLAFCATLAGLELPGQIEIMWTDASPRSDVDAATVATLKKGLGVSNEQLQRELGYTEEEIKRMAVENDSNQERQAELQTQRLNRAPFE